MCHRFLLFFYTLLLGNVLLAAGFVPVVSNYSPFDYGAGLQNWDISQDTEGLMFFGNNAGLLSFDGYTWNLTRMPSGQKARSCMARGRRIYVGSYQEFGYFERNKFGHLIYNSLWKSLKGYRPHNDEIWNIVPTADGHILFQSFCSWFDYDGRTVTPHFDGRHLPLYFFRVGNEIWVQLINDGLYKLAGNRYNSLVSRSDLGDDDVVSALALGRGRVLLVTSGHGLYMLARGRIIPFATPVTAEIAASHANRAVVTRDGTIVIGTIKGGIYGLDASGRLKWHYDMCTMLQNNTVLRLFCDRNNNVWAAFDTGLALVHSGSPLSLLSNASTPLGMVYDVCLLPAAMYIATNQNVVMSDASGMHPVAGTTGQNWHIQRFDHQIVAGNNFGTRIIDGLSSEKVSRDENTSSTCLRQYHADNGESYLLESGYGALTVYESRGGRWQFRNTVRGFMEPVQQFEVDAHGVIWATHLSRGVYRVELSGDLRRAISVRCYTRLGRDEANSQIFVMKIRGDIVLSDGRNLYTPAPSGRFIPIPSLSAFARENILSASAVDNYHYWLSTVRGYMYIEYHAGRYRKLYDLPSAFFGLTCSDYANRTRVDGRYVFFCLNGGVGRMDLSRLNRRTPYGRLRLARATTMTASGEERPVPLDASCPDVHSNLSLTASFPNYDNAALRFVWQLEGGSPARRTETKRPVCTFSNLHYGTYRLTVKVKNATGQTLDACTFSFSRPRPLLLSWPAFVLYFVLLAAAVYLFVRWRTNRMMRVQARRLQAIQTEQNLRLAEQQRIIEEQQRALLEEQLKDKSRELASLSMDAAIHRQQLTGLRQEILRRDNGKPKMNRDLRALLYGASIDDQAYWEVFRRNFDLVHNNFFRNLRERYPSLTTTDLKFCALLRLNMSTKEMAHFTGLTVRGVEGARHRLRKKLNLAEGDSITEFLIDFQ